MTWIFISSNHFHNEFGRDGFCLVYCGGISGLSPLSKLPFLKKVWVPGSREQEWGCEGLYFAYPEPHVSWAGPPFSQGWDAPAQHRPSRARARARARDGLPGSDQLHADWYKRNILKSP